MTLTRAKITQIVYEKIGGFSNKEIMNVVEKVFELMKEDLKKNGSVKITGFGRFKVRSKNQRPGRNPVTGEKIDIKARKALTFKASHLFKKLLNSRPNL